MSKLLKVPQRLPFGLPSNPRAGGSPRELSGSPATPTLPYLSQERASPSPLPIHARFYAPQARGVDVEQFAPLTRQISNASSISSTSTTSTVAASVSSHGSTKAGSISSITKINEKYAISPDPSYWKDYQDNDLEEGDDWLHDPKARRDRHDRRGTIFTWRGLVNLGCMLLVIVAILGLFAGYPVISWIIKPPESVMDGAGYGLGFTNGSGQRPPSFLGRTGLIDNDTPLEERVITSYMTGETYELVFSDEFNIAGRSFYPGDDPYWEAVDLQFVGYHQTGDLEWYDPRQVSTVDGAMRIWFNQSDPGTNHDLNFMGGMVQTWNKFCFTGGIVLASVSLPGSPRLAGLWPAIWTMGNLGRAGYGASLEGMWPYQGYDVCDEGTLANQTLPGGPVPTNGDPRFEGKLSFLPGQRLSRCTCTDDTTHPGPKHDDGTWVGRSAPEIDVFEATVGPNGALVSMSAQWAPFDDGYEWDTSKAIMANSSVCQVNNFKGGIFQQATSALCVTDQDAYTQLAATSEDIVFSTYGYEYKPGYEGSYISWINNGQLAWTMQQAAVGDNAAARISSRAVSNEPMYIIANLGMSPSFGRIDPNLLLPAHMDIDWIRVYQPSGAINVGCDPVEMPTASYIEQHLEAYTNPNMTVFSDFQGSQFPGNRLLGECANE